MATRLEEVPRLERLVGLEKAIGLEELVNHVGALDELEAFLNDDEALEEVATGAATNTRCAISILMTGAATPCVVVVAIEFSADITDVEADAPEPVDTPEADDTPEDEMTVPPIMRRQLAPLMNSEY